MHDLSRYHRQSLLPEIGTAGQERLSRTVVALFGMGALGSAAAELLGRAGVGTLRLIDRDFVDVTNLQRQSLYDETDARERTPKAIAAARRLGQINSQITLDPRVADIRPDNILELLEGVDLVVDGADNFELRLLLNDAALDKHLPWVHGGCVGLSGQVMAIRPHHTPCLRCLINPAGDDPSAEGSSSSTPATCDAVGVAGPAVHLVASLQAMLALQMLLGRWDAIGSQLKLVDAWGGQIRSMDLSNLRENADCRACRHGERLWLSGQQTSQTTVLCGRNAVQISPATSQPLDLTRLAAQLGPLGEVRPNPYLLRFRPHGHPCELTIFRDSRAYIEGTEDPTLARTLYTQYLGG
ncbi:MAG: thiamine biosynthesis protein ThiF [Planctomyces sp.]|nr:thiamine biosynthesis protein ThiF [Planctomyces sp.]